MCNIKLNPCPSCRGTVKITVFDRSAFYKNRHWCIVCCECGKNYGYEPTFGGIYRTKKECITDWNHITPK